MKQICLLCHRQSFDHNLFCPEPACLAELAPYVLEPGEWFEDFEIVRRLVLTRGAVLYKAVHHGQTVLLKIAHPGLQNQERLQREAIFLRQFARLDPAAAIPQLLSPYVGVDIDTDPVGMGTLRESLVYFVVFRYVEGEPLGQMLLQRGALWINHAGWILIQLADAVQQLHDQSLLHLSLTPDSLLVLFDAKKQPRILLWDWGCLWPGQGHMATRPGIFIHTDPVHVSPAYLPPELVGATPQVGATADVYGLGCVFFEMLVGSPVYEHSLRSDDEIARNIHSGRRHRLTREADARRVAHLIRKMIEPSPQARPQSVELLLLALTGEDSDDQPPLFQRLVSEDDGRWFSVLKISPLMLWAWMIALCAIVAIAYFALRTS